MANRTFAPDMQAYLRQREKTENARHEPNPPSDEEWAEIARHERMYQLWEDGEIAKQEIEERIKRDD